MATAKKTTVKDTAAKTTAAPKATTPATDENAWFKKGASGFAEKAKQDTAAAAKRERQAGRFYLKQGEEATVIFIDGDGASAPFFVNEHSVQVDGKWGNFITCVREVKPCPVCESGSKPVYTAYFTVIDTREFTIQKGPNAGKKVKNRRLLYPAKGGMIAVLADQIKKHGSLAGRAFHIKRIGDKDPNCGRDLEHKGKVDLKKLPAEDQKPLEYTKILKPLSDLEMAQMGYGSEPVIGEEPTTDTNKALEDLI